MWYQEPAKLVDQKIAISQTQDSRSGLNAELANSGVGPQDEIFPSELHWRGYDL